MGKDEFKHSVPWISSLIKPFLDFLPLDNKKLIQNLFNWLVQPLSETEVREWMLTQLGSITEDVNQIQLSLKNFNLW